MAKAEEFASLDVGAQLRPALRTYVGPGDQARGYAAAENELAALAGIEQRTVRAHRNGETVPTVATLLLYMRILPVGFAQHVLGLAGLGGVRRVGEAVTPGETLAKMAEGASALAIALADGRIDHQEAATLPAELRR